MRLHQVLVAISRDDWKAGRWMVGGGSPHGDEVAVRTAPVPVSALRGTAFASPTTSQLVCAL